MDDKWTMLKKIDTHLLLKCYSNITELEQIHNRFIQLKFDNKKDQLIIYNTYVNIMLPKCMKEKGFEGLSDWQGVISGILRTSGGNCNFQKHLIKIAEWYIESDITKFDDLKEAILHEIAHANAWLKHSDISHGPLWLKEAKLIGCKGDRCLPKKYCAVLFESNVYKCKSTSDKCVLIKSGSKQALNLFSKKIPKVYCKKHMMTFDHIETKAYEPPDKHRFGIVQEEFVIVNDGDVIDIDSDGEILDIEPDVCIKFD